MKRVIYSIALLAFLCNAAIAQTDTTAVEEEVTILEEQAAAEEPQVVPELDKIHVQIQDEVQEAIKEAMAEMEEALQEAREALEELENDPNLSDAQRARVHEQKEKLMEMEGEKGKIVIRKIDGDSSEKEGKHVIKIKMGHDDEDEPKRIPLVSTSWFGAQFGWANMLNPAGEIGMSQGYEDMNFKGNSWSWDLRVFNQAWNLIGDQLRFTYGLGFTWEHYNLEKDARLYTNNGVLTPVVDENISYDLNRFNTTYASMPVGFQIQMGQGSKKRLKIGGGLHMGYLIKATQRMEWRDQGEFTAKITNNYNLEPFRMGYQATVGLGNVHLYGRYYPNSVFKKDLGPNVNPFSVGVMIGEF